MTKAILFPGQGSHREGMRDLVERYEPRLAELAIAGMGDDPFERAASSTAAAQPAILCASLALWTAAGRPSADCFAGHSLGELSALSASGSIDPADALKLAITRGHAMQAAAESHPGGMVALLGDAASARELATASGAEIANDNGPTQLVAAGPSAAVDLMTAGARERGLKAMKLAVSGAFHTWAMEEAMGPYRDALDDTPINPPAIDVFSSATAKPFPRSAAGIRDELATAVTRPVRWRETLDAIQARGVHTYLEVGPGKALSGMVKRALPDARTGVLEPEVKAHV